MSDDGSLGQQATPEGDQQPGSGAVALGSASGRWLIVAAALGSGVAFLDGSVVTPAAAVVAARGAMPSAVAGSYTTLLDATVRA